MERNEISIHELKVYAALRQRPGSWLTNGEITALVSGVSPRTVRAHTLRLVKANVIDQAEVFPGHRYRWSDKGGKRNPNYTQRLESAAEVFGMSLE
jgi:DNA-binding transcriptional ArsR family regulator